MSNILSDLDYAGLTDIGLERPRNEDYLTILVPPDGAPQFAAGALFIVADGMGGFGGGEVASRSATEELVRRFYAPERAGEDRVTRLQSAVEAANVYVRNRAGEIGLPVIGSTLAGVAVDATGEAIVFNVGDSRVYRLRGSAIERLSRDQSVMEDLRASGRASEDDERSDNNLTAFVGQSTLLTAVVRRVTLQKGDILILCTDGVWEKLENAQLVDAVKDVGAKTAAQRLISRARQSKRGGKSDNLTALVIRYGAPARSRRFWAAAVVVGLVVVILAGILLTRFSAAENAATPTPTTEAAPTEIIATLTALPTAAEAETSAVSIMLEPTETDTPSPTSTPTATFTPTSTATPSPIASLTAAPTLPPSETAAPAIRATLPPTATFTSTAIPATLTATPSPSPTPSPIPVVLSTNTLAATATALPTVTPSLTPTMMTTLSDDALTLLAPLSVNPTQSAPTGEAPPNVTSDEAIIAQGKLRAARQYGVVLPKDTVICTLAGGYPIPYFLAENSTVEITREQGSCAALGSGVWWSAHVPLPTYFTGAFVRAEDVAKAAPPMPVLIVLVHSLPVAGSAALPRGAIVPIVGKSPAGDQIQIQPPNSSIPLWVINSADQGFVWGDLNSVPVLNETVPLNSPNS